MSAIAVIIGVSMIMSVRMWLATTVCPCQCGVWMFHAPISFVLVETYHRTRSPRRESCRPPRRGARSEDSKALPPLDARLERAERRVGVLAKARLAIRRGVRIDLSARAGLLGEVVPLAG